MACGPQCDTHGLGKRGNDDVAIGINCLQTAELAVYIRRFNHLSHRNILGLSVSAVFILHLLVYPNNSKPSSVMAGTLISSGPQILKLD